MKLKRVIDLPTLGEARAVYSKIRRGNIKYYEDGEGYVMFDEEELENYKPKKRGRKPKGGK